MCPSPTSLLFEASRTRKFLDCMTTFASWRIPGREKSFIEDHFPKNLDALEKKKENMVAFSLVLSLKIKEEKGKVVLDSIYVIFNSQSCMYLFLYFYILIIYKRRKHLFKLGKRKKYIIGFLFSLITKQKKIFKSFNYLLSFLSGNQT